MTEDPNEVTGVYGIGLIGEGLVAADFYASGMFGSVGANTGEPNPGSWARHSTVDPIDFTPVNDGGADILVRTAAAERITFSDSGSTRSVTGNHNINPDDDPTGEEVILNYEQPRDLAIQVKTIGPNVFSPGAILSGANEIVGFVNKPENKGRYIPILIVPTETYEVIRGLKTVSNTDRSFTRAERDMIFRAHTILRANNGYLMVSDNLYRRSFGIRDAIRYDVDGAKDKFRQIFEFFRRILDR